MSDPRYLDPEARADVRRRLDVERPTFWGDSIRRILDHSALMDEIVAKLNEERDGVCKAIMGDAKCANLPPYVQSVVNELNEANAIVSRLPRTADGVPITPGMELWVPPTASQTEPTHRYVRWVDGKGHVGLELDHWETTWRGEKCYSTRAAAESALTSTPSTPEHDNAG